MELLVKENIEEEVDVFYRGLNFLKVKKLTKSFLEIDSIILEKFCERYSNVMIYLLNILDPEAVSALVRRLTKSSIFYLIEEESRLLLLSEIKKVSHQEGLEHIVTVLDALDISVRKKFNPWDYLYENKNILFSLEFLKKIKEEKEKALRFYYLSFLQKDELREVLEYIQSQNPVLFPVLLLYASKELQIDVLELVFMEFPQLLKVLPRDFINIKHLYSLKNYVNFYEIYEYLAADIVDKLNYIEILHKMEDSILAIIEENLLASFRTKQEKLLNYIYETLLLESPEVQELIIYELHKKNMITYGEAELLHLLLKESR